MTIDDDPTRPPVTADDHGEVTRLILEGLREGATLSDLKGVSRDTLEGVYAVAHRYYQNGQLEEAEAFFRFLCLYDFYNADYALGMGAVLHTASLFDHTRYQRLNRLVIHKTCRLCRCGMHGRGTQAHDRSCLTSPCCR